MAMAKTMPTCRITIATPNQMVKSAIESGIKKNAVNTEEKKIPIKEKTADSTRLP